MKAVYITSRPAVGDLANKIHLDDHKIATPKAEDLKPNEILVRVQAFSVNIDDLHIVEGSFLGGLPGLQSSSMSEDKPLVLGTDFSGVVEAVGSNIKTFHPGQRVCGLNHIQSVYGEKGSWAEYTVSTNLANLMPIPDDVSFSEAAASVMPLFVIRGLLDAAKLQGNERVAVIGASGGIGSMLIQVLRKMYHGLYIAGVCSGRNVNFVKALGADRVVDYTKGPIEHALLLKQDEDDGSYDVVFDVLGGPSSYQSGRAVLSKRGRYVTCVGPIEWVGDEKLSMFGQASWIAKIIWNSLWNIVPGPHPYYHLAAPSEMDSKTFQLAFEEEGLRPRIEKSVAFGDLTQLKEVLELVRSHRAKGKIVVTMD